MGEEEKQRFKIAVWADGYWCEESELYQQSHKSDDYFFMNLTVWDETEIDEIVGEYLMNQE